MATAEGPSCQLDAKRITEILNCFGCNVTVKEIQKPTMETIIPIYKMFLENCLAVKPVVYEMDPPNIMVYFNEDTAKSQSQSFKFLQFYKLLLYFFDMCSINASFYDIFNPTKKVFNKQISLLINFARFEFSELKEFHAIQNENKKIEELCEIKRKEIEELNAKNHHLKEEKIKKDNVIKAQKASIAQLKEKLSKVVAEYKHMEQQTSLQAQEETSLTNQIKELKARQTQCERKLKVYDKLIIKSPTRLNKEYEKTEANIKDLECLISSKREEMDNHTKLLFEKEKFVENYSTIKDILENFYKQDVLKANEKMKEIEKMNQEITDLNFIERQYASSLATLTAEYDRLKLQQQELINEFESDKLKLNDKFNSTMNAMRQIKLEINILEENKKKIEQQKDEIIRESEKIMNNGLLEIVSCEKETSAILSRKESVAAYLKGMDKDVDDRDLKQSKRLATCYNMLSK